MKKKNILIIVSFALSAVLLTVIGQPFDVSFLAWVALVPFVLGALINVRADASVCPGRTHRFAPTKVLA